ncbi:response regulator [Virgibacillus sp. W0430]|uniref:response regulator n=1 Tax=Virgibacillus sp. W0430 TaxID=3391580 RepID=UPI003F457E11
MIHALFVHEERLYYEGICAIVEKTDDIRMIGMVSTTKAFREQMEEHTIDVVIVNLHLQSINGIELLTQLKNEYPKTSFILLTNYSERMHVVAGVLAGAKGFLLTNASAESVIEAIRNAAADEFVISGEAARILAEKIVRYRCSRKDILQTQLENRGIHLTDRELDVASHLIKRKTNREIAQALHLTEGTIKNYVSELYSTFRFYNRHELIAYLQDLSTYRELETIKAL